jgi:superfamily II DNA/RNA helicase
MSCIVSRRIAGPVALVLKQPSRDRFSRMHTLLSNVHDLNLRAHVMLFLLATLTELGLQVARVAKRLAASSTASSSSSSSTLENETSESVDDADTSVNREDKIMVMNVLQGSQNRRQRAWAWAEPPHLIIGTPQELCDMVRFGGIKRYNSVKYVVVDEVDACLLNNVGSSSSATLTGALSSSTTLLHQLLSKYLSPTFNDGSGSDGDESANGSQSSTSSLLNANAKSANGQSARPVSRQRQTIFASATIPQHRHFLKQVVQNKWTLNLQPPIHVCLRSSSSGRSGGGGEQLIPQTIQHAYLVVSRSTSSDEDIENKFMALRSVLKKIFKSNRLQDDATMIAKKVLIFAENKRPLESMAERLAFDFERSGGMYWTESSIVHSPEYNKARAIFAVLRFEDSLTQRAAAMDSLRGEEDQQQAWQSRITRRRKQQQQAQKDSVSENNIADSISIGPKATAAAALTTTSHRQSPVMRVLLSSDLASRGVDIPDLTHVIQFDIPTSADSYLHMAGRTGRLGRSGQVLSIITPEQEFVLQRLANKLSIDIRCLARQ